MKATLKPGDTFTHSFTVTEAKTVPHLYPESDEFRRMPQVFATGFMIGLVEWACIEALKPHLEDGEGSLGTAISMTHLAPTPPGLRVTVEITCTAAEGRSAQWDVRVRDERDLIGEGIHKRAVVRWDRFMPKVTEKARAIAG
jgi:fluoroacetyl-CoA thioesterase